MVISGVREIKSLKYLKNEYFAPILDVIRRNADHLDKFFNGIYSPAGRMSLGVYRRNEGLAVFIGLRCRAVSACVLVAKKV